MWCPLQMTGIVTMPQSSRVLHRKADVYPSRGCVTDRGTVLMERMSCLARVAVSTSVQFLFT